MQPWKRPEFKLSSQGTSLVARSYNWVPVTTWCKSLYLIIFLVVYLHSLRKCKSATEYDVFELFSDIYVQAM